MKQPRAKRFFELVDNLIDQGVDLKDVLPVLKACLDHYDTLDDMMLLLADLNKTSDPVQIVASMIKLRHQEAKRLRSLRSRLAKAADEVYSAIDTSYSKIYAGERLDIWVKSKMEALLTSPLREGDA